MQLGTSWELENAGRFKSMEPHLRDSEEALEAVWGRWAGGHKIYGFQRRKGAQRGEWPRGGPVWISRVQVKKGRG